MWGPLTNRPSSGWRYQLITWVSSDSFHVHVFHDGRCSSNTQLSHEIITNGHWSLRMQVRQRCFMRSHLRQINRTVKKIKKNNWSKIERAQHEHQGCQVTINQNLANKYYSRHALVTLRSFSNDDIYIYKYISGHTRTSLVQWWLLGIA